MQTDYGNVQMRQVRTPAFYKTEAIPNLCPVCQKGFLAYTVPGGERQFVEFVAVSDQWETVAGDDLYLVTCADHSLADVFNQRRWAGRR